MRFFISCAASSTLCRLRRRFLTQPLPKENSALLETKHRASTLLRDGRHQSLQTESARVEVVLCAPLLEDRLPCDLLQLMLRWLGGTRCSALDALRIRSARLQ